MIAKNDNPQQETHQEWLIRTSLAAEAESTEKGWLTTEQVQQNFMKHREDTIKKHKKASVARM
jgi:hypothetical protein